MRKRYSRSYTVLSFLTMFSYREQPSGQSFLQQRQLSIREIDDLQSALLSHMHGLRGTA